MSIMFLIYQKFTPLTYDLVPLALKPVTKTDKSSGTYCYPQNFLHEVRSQKTDVIIWS
jgi:hypothetical protein